MQYTLWSRGRLIGETDLGFIYRENGWRCGWFHPNEAGERLMPAATGVAPAIRLECIIGPDATARADVLAAEDQRNALELELRLGEEVVATERIAIVDTHYLMSIPVSTDDQELTPEEEAAVEADLRAMVAHCEADDPWRGPEEETEFPRYQIQVQLVDHGWMP